MKKIFTYILVLVINIGLYFLTQIIASFVQFVLFGSGNISTLATNWVSFAFAIFQVLILWLLYEKKVLIKERALFIANVIIVVSMFLYFVVYLSNS